MFREIRLKININLNIYFMYLMNGNYLGMDFNALEVTIVHSMLIKRHLVKMILQKYQMVLMALRTGCQLYGIKEFMLVL